MRDRDFLPEKTKDNDKSGGAIISSLSLKMNFYHILMINYIPPVVTACLVIL
jgi:hypothetical protein